MKQSILEKAFFVDMLSNGVPVKKETDTVLLFEEAIDISLHTMDVDLILENSTLFVLSKIGQKIARVEIEETPSGRKIMFYTADASTALENASVIGQLLFILVNCCIVKDYLSLSGSEVATSKKAIEIKNPSHEEKFEFNPEFI